MKRFGIAILRSIVLIGIMSGLLIPVVVIVSFVLNLKL
jgi:hypothetical protein